MLLAIVFCLALTLPSFAFYESTNDVLYTIYDEQTDDFIPIDEEEYQSILSENSTNAATPRMLVWSFVSYSHENEVFDYEYQLIGYVRVDNTSSSTPAKLEAESETSGSVSATLTTSVGVGAELSSLVAAVKSEVSSTASNTVTWTEGTRYSVSSSVPAGKIGYLYVYIPGISAEGTATYSVLDTSTDTVTTVKRAMGGLVPDKALNYKVVHE